ncbi:MAG TPA: SAM-dependent methyltransferase [Streptosporangiaceae bacterium]|jgi:methyltransferase (TIGR00027 family)
MADGNGEPEGVGRTAIGVAFVRAGESRRPDALFHDPYAWRFVEAQSWRPPESLPDAADVRRRFWTTVIEGTVVRTRFLDEYAEAATRAGCGQVVILGAGLDARAYRLDWPAGVRLFEVDTADVLGFKDRVLDGEPARCARVPVATDLRDDWPAALTAAGFRADEPTAWIAEGLLIYLSDAENDVLMERLGALSAPGSRLGLTLSGRKDGDPVVPRAGAPADGDPGSPTVTVVGMWRSDGPADPETWLAGHGWDATVYRTGERAEAYGRPMTAETHRPRHLVDAVRR